MKPLCLFCGVAVFFVACSVPVLPLNPRHLSAREAIEASSTILIGTVQQLSVSGRERRTVDGILVRTWRVEVEPILVLKGGVTGKKIVFLLNNYEPGIAQNGNFEWLKSGDRRVFFLVSQNGQLRSVSDLYATSILFPHRTVPTGVRGGPIGEVIAALLLTPAPGESPEAFSRMIPSVTTGALRCGGYSVTASLLTGLCTSGFSEISTESCLTAYEQAFGDESCIREIETHNPSNALALRIRKARIRRTYLLEVAQNAARNGRNCPLLLYSYGVEPEDPSSVRGFFTFLAQRPERAFQACASIQLRMLPEVHPESGPQR
jgi:hypothetical protein